jgi:hypothetical protein
MKTMTVARFLEQQIALSGKSQRAIAIECGYPNPNIITMFKKGSTKMPLDKVASMAGALNADPRHLLRLAMLEYHPEAWAVIVKIMGIGVSVTDAEMEMLELARTAGCGRTPCIEVTENRIELTAAIVRAVERDEARDSAAVARLEAMPKNARHV